MIYSNALIVIYNLLDTIKSINQRINLSKLDILQSLNRCSVNLRLHELKIENYITDYILRGIVINLLT